MSIKLRLENGRSVSGDSTVVCVYLEFALEPQLLESGRVLHKKSDIYIRLRAFVCSGPLDASADDGDDDDLCNNPCEITDDPVRVSYRSIFSSLFRSVYFTPKGPVLLCVLQHRRCADEINDCVEVVL